MKKVLIMAANGQISRLVEERVLTEPEFSDVELTLFLRDKKRLAALEDNDRVTLIEGSLNNYADVKQAILGQNLVFVGVVDHTSDNHQTKYVIEALKETGVKRGVFTNILGIYDEVLGEFGRWNKEMVAPGLESAEISDKLLARSGLDYTTLRLPWLNDREVAYEITHKDETYLGVSGSRKSIADVVLRIIADPKFLVNDSVGIADPKTEGSDRPVY